MAINKVIKNSDGQEIHNKTNAGQVVTADGKTVQDFFNIGGTVNGDLIVKGDSKKVSISDSSGNNVWNLCPTPNALSFILNKGTAEHFYFSPSELSPIHGSTAKSLGSASSSWQDIFLSGCVKESTGYTKLPNGMIMQWGSYVHGIQGSYVYTPRITLPIAMNFIAFADATCGWNSSEGSQSYCDIVLVNTTRLPSTNQISLNIKSTVSGLPLLNFQFMWFVIGF